MTTQVPKLIADLTGSVTPWLPPQPLSADDPAWHSAWQTASEAAKVNLARGWLWSVVSGYSNEELSSFTFRVGELLDTELSWIVAIQPYLDLSFFAQQGPDQRWTWLTELFVLDYPSKENAAIVKHLLFGTSVQKKGALLAATSDSAGVVWGRANAIVKAAWRIAADYPNEPAYKQAALGLAFAAGNARALPSQELPEEIRLWQGFGYRCCLATTISVPRAVPTTDAIYQFVQQQPVATAAPIVAQALAKITNQANKGNTIRDTTFLASVCPFVSTAYDVLKAWMPQGISLWEQAKALDLSYVEACALAANSTATSNANSTNLPDDITFGTE